MDIKYRIQEWAADHFKGIQYPLPKPRLIRATPERVAIPMNFGTWLILAVVGSGAVVIGGSVVALMLYLLPAFF
jgi:hypothetical protein